MRLFLAFLLCLNLAGAFAAEGDITQDTKVLDDLIVRALDSDLGKSGGAVAEIKKLGASACAYAAPKLVVLIQRPVVIQGKLDTDERMAAVLVILRKLPVRMSAENLQRLKELTTHEDSIISSFAQTVYDNQINATE